MARWLSVRRTQENLFDHLLAIRGFTTKDLEDNYGAIHSPNTLPDIDRAVDLIIEAKTQGYSAAIFGDYDADGTPGAAVLSILLDQLKIPHQVFIPTREKGYGLKKEAIDALDPNTKLLITVDNGIKAVEEIKYAHEKGVRVLVLDHHLPGDEVPEADALVDTFVKKSKYPFNGLCGCALAYKLTVALEEKVPELNKNLSKWFLDLVAISTVADMMPLVDENRQLVKFGLKVLGKSRWPGVKALLAAAKVEPKNLNETTLGFVLGPRLNATGRMGDNQPALDLLLSKDAGSAAKLAWEIERANISRQELVERITKEAKYELFKQNDENDRFYLVKKAGWSTGVVGLVSGKLSSIHNRPVIVAVEDGESIRGSGRSPMNYSLIDGLDFASEYIAQYGGHRTAAGLTVETKNWEKFVKKIKGHASENIATKDLEKTYLADAIIDPGEVSIELAKKIETIAPFGVKNPSPKFIFIGVDILTTRVMGTKGEHLKIIGKYEGKELEFVLFGRAEDYPRSEKVMDFLGSLEINVWQGKTSLQVKVTDYRYYDEEVELIKKDDPRMQVFVD